MPADDIGEVEWQMWVDYLSREGLSRSRITTHVAVASAIYAWAIVPSRQLATRNPLRLVELPPNDEKPRLRVAFAPEAEQLLEALAPKDAVPTRSRSTRNSAVPRSPDSSGRRYSMASDRLTLARHARQERAWTRASPADRRAAPGVLLEAWLRQGEPRTGGVLETSVMSGKLATRATALEQVEVPSIDECDVHGCAAQAKRGLEAAEAAADDDDTVGLSVGHVHLCSSRAARPAPVRGRLPARFR